MDSEYLNPKREGLGEIHDGNQFFQYRYATVDIAKKIDTMDSFEEFDKFYTYDLLDGNSLLAEYLTELLERYKAKPEVVSIEIGYSHDYVRKIAVGYLAWGLFCLLLQFSEHSHVNTQFQWKLPLVWPYIFLKSRFLLSLVFLNNSVYLCTEGFYKRCITSQ